MNSENNIYKVFFDNLDIGAFILDNQGRYIYVNDAYCATTGKTKDFFYTTSIPQLKKEGYLDISIWEIVMREHRIVPSIISITDVGRQHSYDVLSVGIPHFNEKDTIDMIFYTQEPLDHVNDRLQKSVAFNPSFITSNSEAPDLPVMITESPQMKSLLSTLEPVIPTDATILINGPSGSGKEVLANYIYKTSLRKNEPFTILNCGAVPENLLESELFGYEKGAFTGASSLGKPGVIETADKGTLFLDEINSMPASMQTKLLRVLETKRISRIGATKEKQIDFRLICASNEDLHQLAADHRFRQDLFYRINVISVTLPPLRERKEDILPLANLFLRRICTKYKLIKYFDNSVIRYFEQYSWPGNIRELRNITERLVLTSPPSEIRISTIPDVILNERASLSLRSETDSEASAEGKSQDFAGGSPIDWNENTKSLKEFMADAEKDILVSALNYYSTPAEAARALQIDTSSIYRKLHKHSLFKKYFSTFQ